MTISSDGIKIFGRALFLLEYLQYDSHLKGEKGAASPLGEPAKNRIAGTTEDWVESRKATINELKGLPEAEKIEIIKLFGLKDAAGAELKPADLGGSVIERQILTDKSSVMDLYNAIGKINSSTLSSDTKKRLLAALFLLEYLQYDSHLKGEKGAASPLSEPAKNRIAGTTEDWVESRKATINELKGLPEAEKIEIIKLFGLKDASGAELKPADLGGSVIERQILTKKDSSEDLMAALCQIKYPNACPAPITDPATARTRVLSLAQALRLRDQAAESTTLGYSVGGWLARNLGLYFTGPLTFDVGITGETPGFENARKQVGEPVNTEAASKRVAFSVAPSSTYDLGPAKGYKLLSVALPLAYASEGLWGSSTHTFQYALALSLIKEKPYYRRPNLYLALQGTHYLSDNSVVPNLHESKGFRLGLSARDANLYNWHGAWGPEGDFQLGVASRGAQDERTRTEVAFQLGAKYSNSWLYAHTGLRLFNTTNSTDQSTGPIKIDNLPKQTYQVPGTSYSSNGAGWYGGALADLRGHQLSANWLLGHRHRDIAVQYESPVLRHKAKLPLVGAIGDLSVEASAGLSDLTLTETDNNTQIGARVGLRISRPSFALTPYVTFGTESAPAGTGASWGGGVMLELPFSGATRAQRDNLRALVGAEGMAPARRTAHDYGRTLLGIERLSVPANPDLRTLSNQLLGEKVEPKKDAIEVKQDDIAPVIFYKSGINDSGLNADEQESRQIVSMSDFAKDKKIAREIWDALVTAGYIQEKASDGEPRGLVAQTFSSVKHSDFLASSAFLDTQKTRFYQTLSNAPKLQTEGRVRSGSPAKTRALEIFAARKTMGITTALPEATTLAGDLLSALRVVRDRYIGNLSAFPGLDEAFRAQAVTSQALSFATVLLEATDAKTFLNQPAIAALAPAKTTLTKAEVEKIIQFADEVNTEADSLAAAAREAAPAPAAPAPAAPPAVPSAFGKIEAEDFVDKKVSFRLFTRMKVEENSGVKSLIYIKDGDEASYGKFDFGNGTDPITFRALASSATNGGEITIVVDGKDKYTCYVAKTANWTDFGYAIAHLPNIKGEHEVKLVFKGKEGFLYNLDNVEFQKGLNGTITPKPAEPLPPPPPAPPVAPVPPPPAGAARGPLPAAEPSSAALAQDATPVAP